MINVIGMTFASATFLMARRTIIVKNLSIVIAASHVRTIHVPYATDT